MRLDDFVYINPPVSLVKGKVYPCIMMEEVEPSRRYVYGANQKVYAGGGARFQDGDTLFARITPCLENGKIAQFVGQKASSGFGSTEFIIFRAKDNISDAGFVFYLAKTDIVRKPAEKSMFGASGRQRADVNVIKDIDVPTPPLPVQRKISAILSAYDDLIENNICRIKILEKMAQSVYREWFIHYRFPGYENKHLVDSGTEFGEIPEGWEVRKVGDTFQTIGGGTPSTARQEYWENGEINWYSPSDLTARKAMFISLSGKKISLLGLQKSSATIFPPYSVMMTSRATIGVTSINTTPACTNQGFITCIPNENISTYQIYFWILENLAKIDNVASGATYKEINRTEFRDFHFLVADKKTRKRFDEILLLIGKQIEILLQKNDNLRDTRDKLLPKLVNGEFDTGNVEISITDRK